MRIIGGIAESRILKVPEGLGVRPTPDKVKLALFNSLGDRIAGARVLDLFAGSGALGLECLSRGAERLVSIELSHKHAQFYRANLKSTGLPEKQVTLRIQDVFVALGQLVEIEKPFDLILADPPYGAKNVGCRSTSLAQQLLDDSNLPKLLVPGGRFICGHTRRDTVEIPNHWRERKTLKHGDTLMRILELPVPLHEIHSEAHESLPENNQEDKTMVEEAS